jgi:hypothetical protein
MVAKKLSRFMVVTASPANSTASLGRKKETCPGVCPGVSSICHVSKPGTGPASKGRTRLLKSTVLVGKKRASSVKKPGDQ